MNNNPPADLKELVAFIAQHLVDHPDEVHVSEARQAGGIVLEVHVAPDDMGRVIGKGGKVANDIRALVRVAAGRQNKRATVEIV
jgi:predicted RNA-binding protein YlqC (UPF0109 family)